MRKNLNFFYLTLFLVAIFPLFASAQARNRAAVLDFDGDGKTDFAIYRYEYSYSNSFQTIIHFSRTNTFWVRQTGANTLAGGIRGFTPADYDGDGVYDVSFYFFDGSIVGGYAFFSTITENSSFYSLGNFRYSPFPQDYDGDGKTDLTLVIDSSVIEWTILESRTNTYRIETFGSYPDIKTSGDFDGDGKADIAVYRLQEGHQNSNMFIILRSSDRQVQYIPFGSHDDTPVPADFDGDGITDIAIVRHKFSTYRGGINSLTWHWIQSSDNSYRVKQISYPSKFRVEPTFGDYDGDRKTDVGYYCFWSGVESYLPTSRYFFHIIKSSDNSTITRYLGGISSNVPRYSDNPLALQLNVYRSPRLF